MHYHEVLPAAIEVLGRSRGRYLFPYQIVSRIMESFPDIGEQLDNAFPTDENRPSMGAGHGRYYSQATFISQALDHSLNGGNPFGLDKSWFDTSGLKIEGIIPGDPTEVSIWAISGQGN